MPLRRRNCNPGKSKLEVFFSFPFLLTSSSFSNGCFIIHPLALGTQFMFPGAFSQLSPGCLKEQSFEIPCSVTIQQPHKTEMSNQGLCSITHPCFLLQVPVLATRLSSAVGHHKAREASKVFRHLQWNHTLLVW